jgi:hypothetical protein
MKTHKLYSVKSLFTILLFLAVSCRHDYDTDMTHSHDGPYPEMLLKTQVITLSGGGGHGGHGDSTGYFHTGTIEFTYDGNNRLASANKMMFIYNSDGKLSMTAQGYDTIRYFYEGGLLTTLVTNCGYYEGGKFTDTTRFYYDNGKLRYLNSSYQNITAEFAYDHEGYIKTRIISRIDPGSVICDTLFYTWDKGNLTKLQTRSGYPYVSYIYEREFRYDDHPSYCKAIHYPDEYLLVREITQFYGQHPLFYYEVIPWRFGCENNPVEFTERTNEQQRITEFHVHYNEQGYPLEIHGGDFEMEFIYY